MLSMANYPVRVEPVLVLKYLYLMCIILLRDCIIAIIIGRISQCYHSLADAVASTSECWDIMSASKRKVEDIEAYITAENERGG